MTICNNATIRLMIYSFSGARYDQITKVLDFKPGLLTCEMPQDFHELPERRKFVKIDCKLDAIITYYGSDEIKATIKDISVGGVFISTNQEIELGTICEIQISDIKVTTRVCIHRRQDDYSGYGCIFTKLSEKDEQAIMQYIFQLQIAERKKYLG